MSVCERSPLSQALKLDDAIGEAQDTLAVLSWRYKWDWDGAERELNRAIVLAPSYSCAREDHWEYLSFVGRQAEAQAELSKSSELDPGPTFAITESGVYYHLRDFKALVEASRRGVVTNPNEWVEHYFLGVGYEGTGKRLEAISEDQRAVELSGGDQDAAAALAHFAAIDRRAEAEKILRDLLQKAKSVYVSPSVIATIYAGLGENDKAFEYLGKSIEREMSNISWSLKADLGMDNLRSDPRVESLR
jgi:tetratricopeptide (TPR) repeat protein